MPHYQTALSTSGPAFPDESFFHNDAGPKSPARWNFIGLWPALPGFTPF
jgi:hypothetical protein